jgi:subtilisin family serine protease
MATEQENKCVVTVHEGVDVDALMEEITSLGGTTPYVPQRAVEMHNEKPDSLRNFDVVMTRSEAELLRQDPRIIDVRYGTKKENGYELQFSAIQSNVLCNYDVYSQTSGAGNWGLPASVYGTNPFQSSATPTVSVPYTGIGTGVDVVIMDTGILTTHPEWLGPDGVTSRLNQVDWPVLTGYTSTYSQGSTHYTDTDGHGSHVAGTAVGRYYGWAKGANLYVMNPYDNNSTFGVSGCLNMLRTWHNAKKAASNNPNPTVVNMSFGWTSTYRGITGGVYRGASWSGSNMVTGYGMIASATSGAYYQHPTRISSVDADVTDCSNAGVILVASAGNIAHVQDYSTGQDYNNYYNSSYHGSFRYYHRGQSPCVEKKVIIVGSNEVTVGDQYKSYFSNTGPAVDIFAPGYGITSVGVYPSSINTTYGTTAYPWNTAFKAVKISGTSMSAPQVTGVLALLLATRRQYTYQDCLNWLIGNATNGALNNSYVQDYTNTNALLNAPNRMLRWPYTSSNVLVQTKT